MIDFKIRLIDMDLKPEFMDSEFTGTQHDYERLKIAITSGLINHVSQSG